MIPILYSLTDAERNKKGIIFASSYAEAAKKLEENSDIIVDLYLTSISGESIELSDEMYNKLLE